MIAPTRLELSPLVATAITAHPHTGERAVRGAELLIAGKVQRLPDDRRGADHWLIYGSAAEPYKISIEEDHCTCPDRRRDRARTCKHLHAARFALALGMEPPIEIDPDPSLWAPVEMSPDEMLDAEIVEKILELTAAGVLENAELIVIGDWLWIVGSPDPATMDKLECRWHDRRGCHYWRPRWAAVEGFNEHAGLAELAKKYGIKKQIAQRGRSAVDLAMMLIPKLNRDEDGELWA